MKNRHLYYQLLFLLACLPGCSPPDPPFMEELPTFTEVVFQDLIPSDGTAHDTIPEDITYDFIHHSTVSAYLNPALTYDSIADIEGNVYKTILIGSQTWMAENLKTTMYNDGSAIPCVTDKSVWGTLKTGAYRWYDNSKESYKNLYGALYNWYTVKTGKLCPAGWHVPSDEDWIKLEMALGMTYEQAHSWGEFPGIDGRGTDQAIQMKAIDGWMQWEGKGSGGTNSSGFSALPAGESDMNGVKYYGAGIITTWWESTSEGGGRAIDCTDPGVARGVYFATYGCSVRCVKD